MSYVIGFCKIDNGDNIHKCLGGECFRDWITCDDRIELDLSEFGFKKAVDPFCVTCIFKKNCTDDIEECKEATRLYQSSTPKVKNDGS